MHLVEEIGEPRDISKYSTCKISAKYDKEGDKADYLSPPINSTPMCIGQEWNKFCSLYSITLLTLLVKLLYYLTSVNTLM